MSDDDEVVEVVLEHGEVAEACAVGTYAGLRAELAATRALLDEAASALRFYGNGEHLSTNTWDGSTTTENGATARAVLAKLEAPSDHR